ncbi:diguanylate cyclase [Hydrogenimonas sp.]|uniref:diguanylate cyclase n=1 Tax=Hydrogenimonas sp. TaxID=2231112 RepID=UPI00263117AA|nr:diguanylate cyclase [Hydrogenimonas sp.]
MARTNDHEWLVTAMKCAGIIILGLFLYLGIEQYAESELNAIAKRTAHSEKELISLELETFKNTTDTIASAILDEKTSLLLARLYRGEENNVTVRKQLLKRYAPLYEKLRDFSLEHMRFYLPDGIVLLRLHSPEKYGDSMLASRSSIAMIVQEHKPLHGFESGLYRAIYPIFHRKDFVGIAEISFSFAPMKKVLEKINEEKARYFLVFNLRQIEEGIDEEQLSDYRRCHVDPAFIMRKGENHGIELFREVDFKTSLMPYREFFTILMSRSGRYHVVSFLPLKMIDGSHGGYVIVIHDESEAVHALLNGVQVAKMAVVLIVFVAVLLILMLHFYRVKAIRDRIDPLTGVYNRQGCMVALGNGGRRYALIYIDIDGLGKINEAHGRQKGDEILKTVARIIDSHIRKDDIFCRHGGDEFLLFIANATEDQAKIIADKVRKHVDIHRFDIDEDVTISTGIAIRRRSESIASLIARAAKELEEPGDRESRASTPE